MTIHELRKRLQNINPDFTDKSEIRFEEFEWGQRLEIFHTLTFPDYSVVVLRKKDCEPSVCRNQNNDPVVGETWYPCHRPVGEESDHSWVKILYIGQSYLETVCFVLSSTGMFVALRLPILQMYYTKQAHKEGGQR